MQAEDEGVDEPKAERINLELPADAAARSERDREAVPQPDHKERGHRRHHHQHGGLENRGERLGRDQSEIRARSERDQRDRNRAWMASCT